MHHLLSQLAVLGYIPPGTGAQDGPWWRRGFLIAGVLAIGILVALGALFGHEPRDRAADADRSADR